MAKYIFRISILNKKDHNPLSIVSYYSGQVQIDLFKKNRFMPDPKKKVLYNDLFVPQKNYQDLPDYLKINNKKKEIVDNARNSLWKRVDDNETRFDSQFARLFEVSVPYFLTEGEVKEMVSSYASMLSDYGMCCDASVHKTNTEYSTVSGQEALSKDLKEQDYSCYFLCTMRQFEDGIFSSKKNRDWNSKDQLIMWRQQWVNLLKDYIEKSPAPKEEKQAWEKKMSYKLDKASNNNSFNPVEMSVSVENLVDNNEQEIKKFKKVRNKTIK